MTITAAPASSAMRMHGTEARMRVSSVMRPASSCGHVQVGTDEDALAGDAALGDEVGEAKDFHDAILGVTSRSRA